MFETSLVASQPRRGKPRQGQLLPLAALAHGLLLGGVFFAGAWSVDALPEPNLGAKAVFVVLRPPPPLGDAAGPERPPAPPPRRERDLPPERPVQPSTVPDAAPPALEATEPPPEESLADPGGAEKDEGRGGSPFGAEGGIGEDPAGGSGDGPGNSERPIILRAGITPPQVIHRVLPAYTEPARRARTEGMVILEAIIDTSGRVTAVRVLRSLPFGLEQSAVEAVRQWRYRPALLNGRPQSVYFTLTVHFDLQ
jgi:protein TonB